METVPLPKRAQVEIIQLAPIDTLPNEILISIFETVLRMPISWSIDIPFAVIASHVSSRWRSIAIGTPSFWTNIFISSPKDVGRAASYLERSDQRSIDVTYYPYMTWDILSVVPLSKMLAQHSHRWRRLALLSTNCDDIHNIVSQFQGVNSPKLECLRVVDHNGQYGSGPSILPHFAASRVSLTTLELNSLKGDLRPSYAEFRAFVQSCSSLQNLVLHTCSIQTFSPPIVLTEIPSLQSLTFSGDTREEQFYSFFEFLFTPVIETLELCYMDSEEWNYFCEWMEETDVPRYPRLQSLILVDVSTDEHVDNSFADACPLLRHIAIRSSQFEQSLISTLAGWSYFSGGNGDTDIRWIHLHTLSISDITASLMLIRHIVGSRLAAGIPLRKLRLDRLIYEDDAALDVLRSSVQLELFKYGSSLHRLHHHILESSEDEIDWTKELWRSGIDD
jgi:hypothetical protein